jgi:hypothetical protein
MSAKMTNVTQRLVFDNAMDLLENYGYDLRTAKLTQSFLRSEVLMSTSQSQLHLPILVTDAQNGNAFNTERRLQLTDVFIVSSINVQVAKPASSTDAAYETLNYGDQTVFTTSGVPAAILGAYSNGFLSMIVDNDQLLPAWDIQQHLRVPWDQSGTNVTTPYSGATPVKAVVNSWDGSNDGIVPNEPNFILTGNSNIQFSLNLINAMAAIETTGRWIVRLRGVLAQNCSKVASTR